MLRGSTGVSLSAELASPAPAAARQLVWIFAVSGMLALLGATSPGAPHPAAFVAIGVVDLSVAAIASLHGWQRWPGVWVLVLGVGVGLPVISEAGRHGPLPPSLVFMVLLFVWVGANFPPGTVWWLLPPTAAAFLYAVAPADPPGPEGWIPTLAVVLAGSVIVAETIARSVARLRAAEADARARAAQLRFLAAAAPALNSLNGDLVMNAAVGTLLRLGHDAAAVGLNDNDTGRLRVTHAAGMGHDVVAATAKGEGVAGRALALGTTVVEADHPGAPDALPAVVAAGFRTIIATPVRADDEVLGVLFCAARGERSRTLTDREPVELLAAHVGRALRNAAEYAHQEGAAAQHATLASTDPLTGVGNRRYAETMLAALEPGDAVVLLDLDHVKRVNDTLGHGAGDRVLEGFAAFLRAHVRSGDGVARFGGEEFLVVLRGSQPEVDATGARLVEAWRATRPLATVSAGLAFHEGGWTPTQTLAMADAALYTAKSSGRDRIVAHPA